MFSTEKNENFPQHRNEKIKESTCSTCRSDYRSEKHLKPERKLTI